MIGTKKLFNTMLTDDPDFAENNQKTLEQLTAEYQKGLSPLVLAHVFHKTYNLIWSTSNRFFGLTPQDIASISLERLDFALQTFDVDKTGKFSTYFVTILYNEFRTTTQSLSTNKRKVALHSSSYDQMVENGFDRSVEDNSTMIDLRGHDLTDREMVYCKMLEQDIPNKTIGEHLGVSNTTLVNMRKKLRVKLAKF